MQTELLNKNDPQQLYFHKELYKHHFLEAKLLSKQVSVEQIMLA